MDQTNAIITTIITGIAMIWWYRYSLRLYNRFSWNQLRVDWNEEKDPEEELEDLDPTVVNAMHNKSNKSSKQSGKSVTKALQNEDGTDSGLNDIDEKIATSGGYLTMKVSTMFGRDPWKRRYFVVRQSAVYIYKDKRAFQLDPAKPINKRPIDLEGYSLIADAREPPYLLSLVPIDEEDIRKVWKFRTDTATEYKQWIEMFGKALQLTDAGKQMGDSIIVLHGQSGGSVTEE